MSEAAATAWTQADKAHMRRALELAAEAENLGEVPVGAVVVSPEGDVIGEGCNRTITDHDPTAHAEIIAMREAGRRLGNYRLVGCTLYVTLEPCCMCAGAMIHARLARIVYGADDPKTGAAGGRFDLLLSKEHNHRPDVAGGCEAEASGARLVEFFRARR